MRVYLKTKDGLECEHDLVMKPGNVMPTEIGRVIKDDNNPQRRVRIYKYNYAMVHDCYLYEEDYTEIR